MTNVARDGELAQLRDQLATALAYAGAAELARDRALAEAEGRKRHASKLSRMLGDARSERDIARNALRDVQRYIETYQDGPASDRVILEAIEVALRGERS